MKSCTLKPWATIAGWYLPGVIRNPGILGGSGFRPSSALHAFTAPTLFSAGSSVGVPRGIWVCCPPSQQPSLQATPSTCKLVNMRDHLTSSPLALPKLLQHAPPSWVNRPSDVSLDMLTHRSLLYVYVPQSCPFTLCWGRVPLLK